MTFHTVNVGNSVRCTLSLLKLSLPEKIPATRFRDLPLGVPFAFVADHSETFRYGIKVGKSSALFMGENTTFEKERVRKSYFVYPMSMELAIVPSHVDDPQEGESGSESEGTEAKGRDKPKHEKKQKKDKGK